MVHHCKGFCCSAVWAIQSKSCTNIQKTPEPLRTIEVKSITQHILSTKIRLCNRIPNISTDNDFIAWVKHSKHSPRFDKSQWYNILCIHICLYTHYDPWPLPKSLHVSHIANQQKASNKQQTTTIPQTFWQKIDTQKPTFKKHLKPKTSGNPNSIIVQIKAINAIHAVLAFHLSLSFIFFYQKKTVGSCTKGGFRKGIWLFSRGSVFRLGGVKACGSISWKFLLEEYIESELEIVGGYCWNMFVRLLVLPFCFAVDLPIVADENELCQKHWQTWWANGWAYSTRTRFFLKHMLSLDIIYNRFANTYTINDPTKSTNQPSNVMSHEHQCSHCAFWCSTIIFPQHQVIPLDKMFCIGIFWGSSHTEPLVQKKSQKTLGKPHPNRSK